MLTSALLTLPPSFMRLLVSVTCMHCIFFKAKHCLPPIPTTCSTHEGAGMSRRSRVVPLPFLLFLSLPESGKDRRTSRQARPTTNVCSAQRGAEEHTRRNPKHTGCFGERKESELRDSRIRRFGLDERQLQNYTLSMNLRPDHCLD